MKLTRVLCLLIATASVAAANIVPFTFLNGFSGANEVPPNASTGTGTINMLSYDPNVGAFGTLTIDVSFSGLSGNASSAHVHGYADPTSNATVLQALTASAATAGSVTGMWTLPSQTAADNLFTGLTYINLHSAVFPGGELRGQMVPVPEPAVAGLLAGVGMLAFAVGRRRQASRT
jgi:hypothetical protein